MGSFVAPAAAALAISLLASGCHKADDTRIPAMPVRINLADAGMWNAYGVSGFGLWREFILQQPSTVVPAGFPYSQDSRTGFGGVLLIGGMDPFTGNTSTPLAYDLACPVERKPDIRVVVDAETFMAVCPECGSRYDVTMAAGVCVSGPGSQGKRHYSLRRYQCLPTTLGGYMIAN